MENQVATIEILFCKLEDGFISFANQNWIDKAYELSYQFLQLVISIVATQFSILIKTNRLQYLYVSSNPT